MGKVESHGQEETATSETRAFQAEVGKVLNLVVNSLYSNKEISVSYTHLTLPTKA